jgi:thiol-disulfide isomerase/thioredoxin
MLRSVNQGTSMTASSGGGIVDYVKSNPVIAIIAAAVFAFILYYVFKNYIEPLIQTKYKPNAEHESSETSGEAKQATIMLFFVDWCPHCKTAKPAWEDAKREYDGKVVNGYKVLFSEVNCTEESPEVEAKMNEFGIEGFPTIKMVKDGQIIEFDAKPSKDSISQFINTVL